MEKELGGMTLPLSFFPERINPTPEQFAIHQPMYFRVRAFCGKKGTRPLPSLLFVARLFSRRRNPVALALLPQGFSRETEYLRAGRAAAVYSL